MKTISAILLALGISACGSAAQQAQPAAPLPPEPLPFTSLEAGVNINYSARPGQGGIVCTYTYTTGFKTEDLSDDLYLVMSSGAPTSLSVGGVELPPYDDCTPEQRELWSDAGRSFAWAMYNFGSVIFALDICSEFEGVFQ
ncbi:hypothetical protein KY359_00595 [Candidatus Woesearchaeota archaeon]|nr:hypothetical protein [Candidatus Woesearchaeota archaeon]